MSLATSGKWPNGASAAICLTFDNMGEAADINRNLWPSDKSIGNHYSVKQMLPKFLELARKYRIAVTYFCESWNLGVYPDAVMQIAEEGHEIAWHAWQHENWAAECKAEGDERRNFERSFGKDEGIKGFIGDGGQGAESKVEMYRGFRPPGGIIHGQRTLKMCREYGLGYISPAAEEGAFVPLGNGSDYIAVLPFRWRTVDAYYYMEAFSGLRKMKGELTSEPQPPGVMVRAYIEQIDEAIEKGGFVSFLFHPFLNNMPERLEAMERVLKHLVQQRDEGKIWLARCRDVEEYVRKHSDVLGQDPGWDNTSWR